MLQRSLLEFPRRRLGIRRFPRQASTQVSSFVSSQREFSSAAQKNATPGPGSTGKPSGSGGGLSKVLVAGVAVGTCLTVAYSRGYLDDFLGKNQRSSADLLEVRGGNTSSQDLQKGSRVSHSSENNEGSIPVHIVENSPPLDAGNAKESSEERPVSDSLEDSRKFGGEGKTMEYSSDKPAEKYTSFKEEMLPKSSDNVHAKAEESSASSLTRDSAEAGNISSQKLEDHSEVKTVGQGASVEQHKVDEKLPPFTEASAVFQENKTYDDHPIGLKSEDEAKDTQCHAKEISTSLLETYNLVDGVEERASTSSAGQNIKHSSLKDENSVPASGDTSDVYVSKDGKLILDFLQAIHAAEQRQAELDARIFGEEKRAIKEKYEKELKDARARELMYAEEAAMLEKELEKERAKAAAALKSLQEKAEERLKKELEEKEREAKSKIKGLQEFAKAELAASLAREKAAQVEKMAEANLNINALCMAFYARSEEARQTHSIHKLALGTLALDDALANGLPVQAELDALQSYIESVDKDSLLQLALSSLPEDVRHHGTDSPLQLGEKFDKLKGSLRHFSLLPPGGGGILAHSLAYVASFLKVKEADQSGDGIESVINKVESLLAEGKLAEAADVLEDGVKGSKAAEVVSDWLRRARNRAITEQALVLLQSYAASVSLT